VIKVRGCIVGGFIFPTHRYHIGSLSWDSLFTGQVIGNVLIDPEGLLQRLFCFRAVPFFSEGEQGCTIAYGMILKTLGNLLSRKSI
jgi:hypothetical protein